jgi:hypothetical protein
MVKYHHLSNARATSNADRGVQEGLELAKDSLKWSCYFRSWTPTIVPL